MVSTWAQDGLTLKVREVGEGRVKDRGLFLGL